MGALLERDGCTRKSPHFDPRVQFELGRIAVRSQGSNPEVMAAAMYTPGHIEIRVNAACCHLH